LSGLNELAKEFTAVKNPKLDENIKHMNIKGKRFIATKFPF
tara:strand:+ start:614 stop:736 length:123 start_codon:yes stop_codon:yes gene_type:complete